MACVASFFIGVFAGATIGVSAMCCVIAGKK